MSELAGRVMSSAGKPVHVPVETQGAQHVGLSHPGPNDMHPRKPHLKHHDGPLESDPARQGVHDGTTYAMGATGTPYEDEAHANRPELGERIKEALPGTKEHKAKKEAEGNLAVYS